MISEAERAERGHGYAVIAPYYDLIFPPEVRSQQASALRALLGGVHAVAEIGPGTGGLTEVLVELVPHDGEIFAVEPLAVMRAALATRLCLLPGAAERVTILPADALTMALPAPVDAIVMMNVLTHFTPADRLLLWRQMARALRPGGILVFEVQHPQTVQAVPMAVLRGRRMGRHRYDATARAEPAGPDTVRWTMTYRTVEGEEMTNEEVVEFEAFVVSTGQLSVELTEAGFARLPDSPDGVLAWRRATA